MSSDWAAKKAATLVPDSVYTIRQRQECADEIATALREAARVPEGHVRTADGVDRKVLGTLPITADGCVAGESASLWHPKDNVDGWRYYGMSSPFPVTAWSDMSHPAIECYSTREAAEAATSAAARGVGQCTCNRNSVDDDEHAPDCGKESRP